MIQRLGLTLITLVFCLSIGGIADAQATAVDYTKAHLTWTEDVTAGVGIPTAYTVKCGTVAKTYTKIKTYPVAPPLTTASGIMAISDMITISGTYFCAVSASNVIGESADSTELMFQAGRIPPAPSGLAVTPN